MARTKGPGPVKDCFIGIRVDPETKEKVERMAAQRDMTVSYFLTKLIESGARTERQRREILQEMLEEALKAC